MIKKLCCCGLLLSLPVIFTGSAFSQECIRSPDEKLTELSAPKEFRIDVSSFRCPGGVITIGDLIRDVRRKCGDPVRETCPGNEPYRVLVYRFKQSPYKYFLNFIFEKVQRIQTVRCESDDPDCR